MSYDIFISHSSQSSETAMAIVEKLESEGAKCWVAPRDLDPGSDWAEGIINGIEDCPLFLLILCPHANESPQVLREVERAVSKKKPVIPLLTTQLTLSKSLEYFVSSHHWLEFATPPTSENLTELARIIRKKLAKDGAPLPEKEIKTPPAKPAPQPFYKNGAIVSLTACLLIIGCFFLYKSLPTPTVEELAPTIIDKQSANQSDIEVAGSPSATPGESPKTIPEPSDNWQKIENLVVDADFSVPVTTNKKQIAIGDNLEISCTPPKSGYLTLFAHTLDTNKVTMLFPNSAHKNNYVEEGTVVQIPGPDDTFTITADEDTGKTLLVAFLHQDTSWMGDVQLLQRDNKQLFLEMNTGVVTRGLTVNVQEEDKWMGVGRLELQVVE